MGIKVSINERTKADIPEKPENDGKLPWNLGPGVPCPKPPKDRVCPPPKPPIPPDMGPPPPPPPCPPIKPAHKTSPVVNESENELYEKILKALEKDDKRHYTIDLPEETTEWVEDGEFFYTTIKASKHNVIYPIVKDVFILNDKGNYEATFFSYEVLANGDIRIISSAPHNYKVYIESEE